MKDQRSYFEKADFHSNLPLQFLSAAVGLMLVVVDGINPFYQLDSKGNAIDVI